MQECSPLLTGEIKSLCGYGKGGQKGFETVITRLQMQTYVNISDFVYKRDSHGKPYGWGVALYSLLEGWLGEEFISDSYGRPPQESKERIFLHLKELLPKAAEGEIWKLIA